jgi:hypothetical protein
LSYTSIGLAEIQRRVRRERRRLATANFNVRSPKRSGRWAVDLLDCRSEAPFHPVGAVADGGGQAGQWPSGQLGNRLVGILHGCLKTSTAYNETTAWAHLQPTS